MAQNKTGNQPKVKKSKPAKKPASKPKAAAAKPREDLRPVIMRAAMVVAGRDGWTAASPAAIAAEAGLSVSDVTALYADIWEILPDVLDDIEDRTEDTVRDYLSDSWRDNLHEILMTRFDFAQDYRAALTSLPAFAARHPRHSRKFVRRLYDTLHRMLLLSRMDDDRVTPPAIGAFSLIYVSLVDRWSKDDSADMSPTMAAIDKRLGWFEKALPYIGYIDCPSPVKDAAGKAATKAKTTARKVKSKAKEKFKAAGE